MPTAESPLFTSAFLAFCSTSLANELLVPSQYSTIQSAIDAAADGDTVIVAPGTYTGPGNRDIDFRGKAITVKSESGPESCIIDCQESGCGFFLQENSVIEGFTVANGCRWCGHTVFPITWRGAGILCDGQSTIRNCIIRNNYANIGAGIYGGSPTIVNCLITGNKTGSAIYCYANTKIINCTIVGNISFPEAVAAGDNTTIVNSILRDNLPDQLRVPHSSTVVYNNIQGGWVGKSNVDVDPCFVEPGYWDDNGTPGPWWNYLWVDGDYHLKSEDWRWDSDANQWTWDEVTSRCIDAGNPGSPLGDEPLTLIVDPLNRWGENLRIDMGAYGGTAEASMPPYDWALLADLTNDGLVDLKDYAFQAADWLNSADQQPGDLNRDSLVDISDLALLVEDWLGQTTWH